jgi:hypothetical protein
MSTSTGEIKPEVKGAGEPGGIKTAMLSFFVIAFAGTIVAVIALAAVVAQPPDCPATLAEMEAATPALEEFIAVRDRTTAKVYTDHELAGIQWFTTFLLALKVKDVPISQGGTLSNCRYILRNQYAPTATVDLQLPNGGSAPRVYANATAASFGFPSSFDGINILPMADCILFGGVKHWESFLGESGMIKIEHCPTADGKGIWKGQDVPFRNATGNSMDVPPEIFEDVGRYMYLKGAYNAEGYLYAEKLTMCVGTPCDESIIPYAAEWDC